MATETRWVGDRLRELREGAGLSQAELADAVGVSRETIARWETNQREPNWTSVYDLARALRVDCTAFVVAVPPKDTAKRKPGRQAKGSAPKGKQS